MKFGVSDEPGCAAQLKAGRILCAGHVARSGPGRPTSRHWWLGVASKGDLDCLIEGCK